eukprot:90882_1
MAAKDQSIYLNSLDHDSNISRRLSIIRTNPPFSFIPTRNFNWMRNTTYSAPSPSSIFHRQPSDAMAPTSLLNTLWRTPSMLTIALFCIPNANLRNKHAHKWIAMMLLIASISLINAQNSSSYFERGVCGTGLYCIDGQDCDIMCNGAW